MGDITRLRNFTFENLDHYNRFVRTFDVWPELYNDVIITSNPVNYLIRENNPRLYEIMYNFVNGTGGMDIRDIMAYNKYYFTYRIILVAGELSRRLGTDIDEKLALLQELVNNLGNYVTLRDIETRILGNQDNGHLTFRNRIQRFYHEMNNYLIELRTDAHFRGEFYYANVLQNIIADLQESTHNIYNR